MLMKLKIKLDTLLMFLTDVIIWDFYKIPKRLLKEFCKDIQATGFSWETIKYCIRDIFRFYFTKQRR